MYEINPELKHRVISKIPAGYNSLQTCLFVYSYLCSTLEYSMDYYANEELFAERYQNMNNLKQVDGVKNKNVVCYTLIAIYHSIIESLNLKGVKLLNGLDLDKNGNFADYHDYLTMLIDGTEYEVDPLPGVLQNNDLVDLKFKDRKIKNFRIIHTTKRSAYNELEQAIDQVQEDLEIEKLSEDYIKEKAEEFKPLPLEKRFKLFMDLLEYTPEYSVTSLNYIQTIKHNLFDIKEYHFSYGKEKGTKQYFQTAFVRQALTGEIVTLIFFNKNGYNLQEKHNFDSLQIFEYSIKKKELRSFTRNDLYERIIDKFYYETDGYGNDLLELNSDLINMAVDPNFAGI